MSNITAQQVKELRAKTGAGMMDCKKALTEAEGDLDKAIEQCAEDEFSILMTHDPTHWQKVVLEHSKHIQLTLSGHTHGMQMGVEIPFLNLLDCRQKLHRSPGGQDKHPKLICYCGTV